MYIWVTCKISRNLGSGKGDGEDDRGGGSAGRPGPAALKVATAARFASAARRRADELVSLRSPPPTMDAVDLFQC